MHSLNRASLLVALSRKLDSFFCLVFVCNLPLVAMSEQTICFFLMVSFLLVVTYVLFASLFLLPPVYYFNPRNLFIMVFQSNGKDVPNSLFAVSAISYSAKVSTQQGSGMKFFFTMNAFNARTNFEF